MINSNLNNGQRRSVENNLGKTLAEQVQVILEQHETELYYRTNGIAPEEYPKIAERIVELFENQNETNETESH